MFRGLQEKSKKYFKRPKLCIAQWGIHVGHGDIWLQINSFAIKLPENLLKRFNINKYS